MAPLDERSEKPVIEFSTSGASDKEIKLRLSGTLAAAIEPQFYDLYHDSAHVERARFHSNALLTATQKAIEKVFAQYEYFWIQGVVYDELRNFFQHRNQLYLEEHGALPFADPLTPGSYSSGQPLSESDGRPLNPPATRVADASSIYDITPEDMERRAQEWLQSIVDHIGVPDWADVKNVAPPDREFLESLQPEHIRQAHIKKLRAKAIRKYMILAAVGLVTWLIVYYAL